MELKLLSAITFASGLLAVPAMAADVSPMGTYSPPPPQIYQPEPMVSGQLRLFGGILSAGDGYFEADDSVNLFGGRGSANVVLPYHVNLRTQLDLIGLGILDDGFGVGSVLGLAHIHRLEPGKHAYGVFGGGGAGIGFSTFVVGAEAQHFWGPVTVGGDVAYWMTDFDDIFAVSGYLAYYFSPQTKLLGRVGYATVSDFDLFEVSGRIDHRFASTPFGLFGEVAWTDTDYGDATRFLAGLNVDIDAGGTRLSHDRNNTLWDTWTPLLID